MTHYLQARLLALVPVLLLMSFVVFSFIHLMPGDPVDAMLGSEVDAATKAALRHQMGFDQPLARQYLAWAERVVRGDFGLSVRTQQPVASMLVEKLPVTLLLTAAAMAFALAIALPLGIVAAVRYNTVADMSALGMALVGVSIPSFWLGVMLILVFALHWHLLPSTSYVSFAQDAGEALRHLILPAATLGLGLAGALTRMVRSGVLEELSLEYVRTARAKGLKSLRVINRHVLKNALFPTLTVLGVQVSVLLGGAVITEQIFAWPGVGQLIVTAVAERDYPTLQATILVVAALATVVQLIVDVFYALMDPRVRYQ